MSKFEEGIGNNLLQVNGRVKITLKECLKKKGMTRYRLAKITGIRYDSISKYYHDTVTLINKEYLRIFCSVLDCTISDLIQYNNKGK